jgi:hypothetical protein
VFVARAQPYGLVSDGAGPGCVDLWLEPARPGDQGAGDAVPPGIVRELPFQGGLVAELSRMFMSNMIAPFDDQNINLDFLFCK